MYIHRREAEEAAKKRRDRRKEGLEDTCFGDWWNAGTDKNNTGQQEKIVLQQEYEARNMIWYDWYIYIYTYNKIDFHIIIYI